jgi:CubicO group peptidase (beta-lactamase class C family)
MDLIPQAFSAEVPNGRVEGMVAPKFRAVADAFVANFRDRNEVGGSVAICLDGEPMVDLWGGLADPSSGRAWDKDTISIVFSCTKGATAILAHHLAYLGKLDLDAPVITYWPEFAANGKEHITVRMLLNHTAGLAGLNTPAPEGAFADWDQMASLFAAAEPLWPPGTRTGYHAISFGWLVGEVIRRITGMSVGQAFDAMIAGPLAAPFWIGLPETLEDRVAPMLPTPPGPGDVIPQVVLNWLSDPQSIAAKAFVNASGGFGSATNSRAGRAAEVPGANGVSNARGLAKIYAPLACGGRLHAVTLTDRAGLARMGGTCAANEEDASLLVPVRFALGFMKSMDNRRQPPGRQESAIIGASAFGHVGMGGSIGFADPDCGLSFGYSMNRMGIAVLLNERGQSLVDATYQSIGYSTNAPGAWIP